MGRPKLWLRLAAPILPAPRRDARLAEQGRGRDRGDAQGDGRLEDTGLRASNVVQEEGGDRRIETKHNLAVNGQVLSDYVIEVTDQDTSL